jgi:hypothetical protein
VSVENDVDFAVGIGAVRDLLERQGIDPSEVGRLHRIKDVRVYQGLAKVKSVDDAGNEVETLEVQDMASVVLSPKWEDGPQWDLVNPGPTLPKDRRKGKVRKGVKKGVILPDMQIGYYHGTDGQLVSTHDPKAINLAITVVEALDPDLIVMVGDNLDLPEFGKYRLTPAFENTTQATVDYATELMWNLRSVAPKADIVWLAGNHEERLPNFLLDNCRAAFGLRRGKDPQVNADTRYPVMSVPHLCRLDRSDITYLEGYPANEYYVNQNLRVIHGNRVKSRGSTAHVYLNEEKTSVLYGHIHRIELAHRTFKNWDGQKSILAASPGTLAKVDGAVPSTKGGIDLYGRPLNVVEDWQQGIGIVDFETGGDHWFNYETVPFINYRCKAEGVIYTV